MKTKEEIFEAFQKICRDHDYFNHRIFVYDELKAFFDKSLTDYSDQQNKELREENEELRKGLMFQGLVPNSKDAEIQRLTKEVYRLNEKVNDICENKALLKDELPRLRELLGRTEKWLRFTAHQEAADLLKEIKSALNPVYSPPYIEGKTDLQNEG